MDTLKSKIIESLNLPEDNFNNHCSDLQVLYSESLVQWLKKNYVFYNNVTVHYSNITGQNWFGKKFLEIPFAHNTPFVKKY